MPELSITRVICDNPRKQARELIAKFGLNIDEEEIVNRLKEESARVARLALSASRSAVPVRESELRSNIISVAISDDNDITHRVFVRDVTHRSSDTDTPLSNPNLALILDSGEVPESPEFTDPNVSNTFARTRDFRGTISGLKRRKPSQNDPPFPLIAAKQPTEGWIEIAQKNLEKELGISG